MKPLSQRFKHGRVLAWLNGELGKIEHDCWEMLISARSSTGNPVEQLDLSLPVPFVSLFQDIARFLVSILRLIREPSKYEPAVHTMHSRVEESLRESEIALMRAGHDFREVVDGGSFLHESIQNADTLMFLLLQNALALSCHEQNDHDDKSPCCDIMNIYWRWTVICLDRARREASAHMYEEVRQLNEELRVVIQVLQDQKAVFDQAYELRESPRQTLDNRVCGRIRLHLEDTISHFENLKNFAAEAESTLTNSISVRNEGNSKAIFIFTTITVIFLPLTFISGFFSMNLTDLKDPHHSSGHFWAIAVPVTIAVFVACLIMVRMRFRFRIRRRIGSLLIRFFPEKGRNVGPIMAPSHTAPDGSRSRTSRATRGRRGWSVWRSGRRDAVDEHEKV